MEAWKEFEGVCIGTQDPDNPTRIAAERKYGEMRSNSSYYFPKLFQTLQSTNDSRVRMFCCVMLRQDVSSDVWGKSSSHVKGEVKKSILRLVSSQQNDAKLCIALAEAAGALASRCYKDDDGWPDLIPFILKMSTSNHPSQTTASLTLVATIAEYAMEKLKSHKGTLEKLHGWIGKILQMNVDGGGGGGGKAVVLAQVAAIKALVQILMSLKPDSPPAAAFGKLIGGIFKITADVSRKDMEDRLLELLTQSMTLVVNRFNMILPLSPKIIDLMVSIAMNGNSEGSCTPENKRLALSIIVQIASRGRSNIKTLPSIQKSVIPAAFSFLKKVEMEVDEWADRGSADFEEEDFRVGMETLDYLSCYLGAETFFPGLWRLLPAAFSSKNWRERHAGLMGICAASEGSASKISEHLQPLVKFIVPLINKDPHARVRWAALNTVAHLCAEFSPALQQAFGRPLLEAIVGAMRNRNNPARVTRNAAMCIVDYCSRDEKNTIQHFLKETLSAINDLLKPSRDPRVLSGALAALAATAESAAAEKFTQYYQNFMPNVVRLLIDARDHIQKEKQQQNGENAPKSSKELERRQWMQELRVNAVYCIEVIARSVNKDIFEKDSKKVMNILASTQTLLDSGDPTEEKILDAYSTISRIIGENFGPYLRHVVPPLLRAGVITDDIVKRDSQLQEDDQKNGYEYFEVSVRGVGTSVLAINTSKVEDMFNACLRLGEYARGSPKSFNPYLQETVKMICPLIEFKHSPRVRIPAYQSVSSLVYCAATSNRPSAGNALLVATLPFFNRAAELEEEADYLSVLLASISDSIDEIKQALDDNSCKLIDNMLVGVLQNCRERLAEYEGRLRDKAAVDEQEREEIQESRIGESKMIGNLNEVIKSLLKNTKNNYLKIFHNRLLRLYSTFLKDDSNEDLQNAGICCLIDVIETVGKHQATMQYSKDLLPLAIAKSTSKSIDVRHSAVYCIGMCATMLGAEGFAPFYSKAMQGLVKTIESKNEADNGPAADNAISSVGKIAIVMGLKAKKEILGKWISYLPCKHDVIEAKRIHSMLCGFLENESDAKLIYGANNNNLPKLISTIVAILGNDLAEEAVLKKFTRILKNLLQIIGPDGRRRIHGMLNDSKHRAIIQRVWES